MGDDTIFNTYWLESLAKNACAISVGQFPSFIYGLTKIVKIIVTKSNFVEVFDDRGVQASISFTQESMTKTISSRVGKVVLSIIDLLRFGSSSG